MELFTETQGADAMNKASVVIPNLNGLAWLPE